MWTAKAVYQAIGKVPHYIRPPFGDMDARTKAVFNTLGLTSIIWNADSKDAGLAKGKIPTVTAQATQWSKEVNPDGILSLEHDLFEFSAQAIGPVLEVVKKSTYKPVPISVCAANENIGPVYLTSGKFYDLVVSTSGSFTSIPSLAGSISHASLIALLFSISTLFIL